MNKQPKLYFNLNINNQSYPLIEITGIEKLSHPFYFKLTFIATIKTDETSMLGKKACLEIQDQANCHRQIMGIILKTKTKYFYNQCKKMITSTLCPRISLLQNFSDIRLILNKDIADIILDELVSKAGYCEHQICFHLDNSYSINPSIMQTPGENSLDFINRLLAKNGIFYWFEVMHNNEQIHFSDHNNALRTHNKTLAVCSSNLGHDMNSLFEFEKHHKKTQSHFIVRNYNEECSNITTFDGNKSNSDDLNSTIDSFGFGACNTQEAKKLADDYTQRARVESFEICAKTHAPNLFPGKILPIKDTHSPVRNYLITETRHYGYFHTHDFSEGQSIPYYNKIKCINYSETFRSPIPPQPLVPFCFTATIESTGHRALLDEIGRYKIRYHFDHSQKPIAEASKHLHKLEFYGGNLGANDTNDNKVGSHFPLQNGAEVLISCFNNNSDMPFIIGTLPNSMISSPITLVNSKQNRLVTQSGHELLMNDHKNESSIVLKNPNDDNYLEMASNTQKNNVLLKSDRGDINFYSKKNCYLKTHEDLIEKSGKDHQYDVVHQYTLKTKQGPIKFQAKKSILFEANNQLTLQCKENLKISADHDIKITGHQNIYLRSSEMTCCSKNGRMNIEAAKKIEGSSTGHIFIGTHSSGILLEPSGKITVFAIHVQGGIRYNGTVHKHPGPKSPPQAYVHNT